MAHEAVAAMKDGEMIMIENLQRDPREIVTMIPMHKNLPHSLMYM